MFFDVKLQDRHPNSPVLIPGIALIIDSTGKHVSLLCDTRQRNKSLVGTVHFQAVATGRDDSVTTEILAGLTAGVR